ncbi:MAG: RNase H family protein [Clostridia bacterium]|nr:RNase H family protein [Clostridia bacterium]
MTPHEVALRLRDQLLLRSVPCEVGDAISQYCSPVRLDGYAGRVLVYSGRKGPSMVLRELKGDGQIERVLEKAWLAATHVAPTAATHKPDALRDKVPRGGVRLRTRTTEAPSQPGMVNIWVDGSKMDVDGGISLGWGLLIMEGDAELLRDSGSGIPRDAWRHFNVAAEITAVVRALEWCRENGVNQVAIHYDYLGLEMWATRRWKANTPFTKEYVRRVAESGIKIAWFKVRSHSGDPRNDLVDALAREAAVQASLAHTDPDS